MSQPQLQDERMNETLSRRGWRLEPEAHKLKLRADKPMSTIESHTENPGTMNVLPSM
jgi:DNA-binding winged helix-turn-helix (wHTH) protein